MDLWLESVIFDFDGLILDTEIAEVRAWNELYDELNVQIDPDWWTHSIGRGPDQDPTHPFEFIPSPIANRLDRLETIANRNRRRIELVCEEPPMPGVTQLIEELKSNGIKLAVASSSRHEWVDIHLSRLGLFESFDEIVCAEDAKFTKPAPDLYEMAIQKLKTSSSRTVALEDSPAGCTAAIAAKLSVIAVPNPLTKTLTFPAVTARWESLAGKYTFDINRILK